MHSQDSVDHTFNVLSLLTDTMYYGISECEERYGAQRIPRHTANPRRVPLQLVNRRLFLQRPDQNLAVNAAGTETSTIGTPRNARYVYNEREMRELPDRWPLKMRIHLKRITSSSCSSSDSCSSSLFSSSFAPSFACFFYPSRTKRTST